MHTHMVRACVGERERLCVCVCVCVCVCYVCVHMLGLKLTQHCKLCVFAHAHAHVSLLGTSCAPSVFVLSSPSLPLTPPHSCAVLHPHLLPSEDEPDGGKPKRDNKQESAEAVEDGWREPTLGAVAFSEKLGEIQSLTVDHMAVTLEEYPNSNTRFGHNQVCATNYAHAMERRGLSRGYPFLQTGPRHTETGQFIPNTHRH